jgi:beta-fructofuranosidase
MGLTVAGHWVWDFWLTRDGDEHHVFFLQAPSSIGDPELRHWNVSIGHAVSRDLVGWKLLPTALEPGRLGSWDDASTWTGSVIAQDGGWSMLYTGTSRAENGLVQRIGIARSDDLMTWHKQDGPVLEADPRQYETAESGAWHDQAWRDPWVFVDPADGQYHVLLTARATTGESFERGVIGHASSVDLVHWEVLPPVTAPMGFGQLEVPQLVVANGRWYLLFCSDLPTQGANRREHGPGTGTYYLVGDSPTGPFTMLGDGVLDADRRGSSYAGKIHEAPGGELVFLSWQRTRSDGSFHGALSDPRPIEFRPDGRLRLAR